MRSVYAHFPINVAISESNTLVDIRNFLGEKFNRQVRMLPGVTCIASKDMKDEFVLEGNDIELVSRSGKFLVCFGFVLLYFIEICWNINLIILHLGELGLVSRCRTCIGAMLDLNGRALWSCKKENKTFLCYVFVSKLKTKQVRHLFCLRFYLTYISFNLYWIPPPSYSNLRADKTSLVGVLSQIAFIFWRCIVLII